MYSRLKIIKLLCFRTITFGFGGIALSPFPRFKITVIHNHDLLHIPYLKKLRPGSREPTRRVRTKRTRSVSLVCSLVCSRAIFPRRNLFARRVHFFLCFYIIYIYIYVYTYYTYTYIKRYAYLSIFLLFARFVFRRRENAPTASGAVAGGERVGRSRVGETFFFSAELRRDIITPRFPGAKSVRADTTFRGRSRVSAGSGFFFCAFF